MLLVLNRGVKEAIEADVFAGALLLKGIHDAKSIELTLGLKIF